MARPGQRLVVLFDGTWNDHHKETNVYRMAKSIRDFDGEIAQRFYYHPGVGTSRFDRIRGGLLGYGLSQNLLAGYDWLARNYREGDEIYVFGFSRGAYTARSLAGMIRKCGLIEIVSDGLLADAEALYRSDARPDDQESVIFRANYSTEATIKLVGVWDTVGSLGIPYTVISERGLYKFHDTRLSRIVEHAYQALALDEHRGLYDAVLWTGEEKPGQQVEQLWFIGAHSNVGGGYPNDPLAMISLEWMQRKAALAGLKLKQVHAQPEAYLGRPRDSFREMAKGKYAFVSGLLNQGDGRHYRIYDRNSSSGKAAAADPFEIAVNVGIHPSVRKRMREDPNYRPRTLVDAELTPEFVEKP